VIRGGPRRRPDEINKRFDADISKTRILVQSDLLKISTACGEPGPRIDCPFEIHRAAAAAARTDMQHTPLRRVRANIIVFVFCMTIRMCMHFLVECRA